MRGGKKQKLPLGYTIVETMMFVAISGFMFLIAANFISGRQANAEFKQGINSANTAIQDAINQVANGSFPSNGDFSCTAGDPPTISSPPAKGQGTNLGCIFLGKVIQFGVQGTGSDSDGYNGYNIYTIAGDQYASGSSGTLATKFSETHPIAVDNSSINLTDKRKFEWGVTVTKMVYGGSDQATGAIGFVGSFGQYDIATASLNAGSQSVQTVVLPDSALGQSESQLADPSSGAITRDLTDANVANPNVIICFQGGKGQVASITIGGKGHRLTTDMEMGNDMAPECRS